MRRNVWIAGLTILFAAGTLTMAPAFAFAAETLPQGIYAGELDLAGVPAEEAKETVSQYVEAGTFLGKSGGVRGSAEGGGSLRQPDPALYENKGS